MKILRLSACVIVAAVMAGCAHGVLSGLGPVAPGDEQGVFEATSYAVNPASGKHKVKGPMIVLKQGANWKGYQAHVAAKEPVPAPQWLYGIAFFVEANRYLYVSRALWNDEQLQTELLDRQRLSCSHITGCLYREIVVVGFSAEHWQRAVREGLSLRLVGSYGRVSYNIPAAYFAGVLRRVEEHAGTGADS